MSKHGNDIKKTDIFELALIVILRLAPFVIVGLDPTISREKIPDRVCYANIAASSAGMAKKSSKGMTMAKSRSFF